MPSLTIFFSILLHFSYVGNLDRRCTEQFIKDIFAKCGKVVRCKMINAVGSYLLLCIECCKLVYMTCIVKEEPACIFATLLPTVFVICLSLCMCLEGALMVIYTITTL